MRTALLIFFSVIAFSSCNTYRYITIASDNASLNDRNEFVIETDTVSVVYNFHGRNGPVKISVYNKSGHALQVDWKKSALIINDKPVIYYKPDLWIKGSIENAAALATTNTINVRISGEEGLEFLPPRSAMSRTGVLLVDQGVLNPAYDDTHLAWDSKTRKKERLPGL
jgi:hypothetical protein